jgi:hypothetical protein
MGDGDVVKKVIIQVCVILFLLTVFNVTICQAQGDNATIDMAEAFANENGKVTVSGSISSGPGQQITIAVIDPGGSLGYANSVLSTANGDFAFSYVMTNGIPGTYAVRLGGSGVEIPVTVTFYSPVALLGVSASLNSGQVVASGRITTGAGQQITIDVTDPRGQPDYVDSTLSQADGEFVFLYPLASMITGTYHVKIGAEGISNPVIVSFPYGCTSDDATLENLELSAGSLDQVFAPETVSYTATMPLDVSSVAVIPSACDANASVKVNGESVTSGSESNEINLADGNSTISVVVTAQDGVTTKTYTVKIARGYTLSDLTARISQTKQVTVSGRISSGTGQVISVAITDPGGNYEYVNSTLSTDGGDFSFSYPMLNDNTPGTYMVKVGGGMVAEPATATFNYMPMSFEGGGGVTRTQITAVTIAMQDDGTLAAVLMVGNPSAVSSNVTASYQWQECTTEDGAYAAIGTSSTYAPGAADMGHYIEVVATGTGQYAGTVTSAPLELIQLY